MKTKLAKLIKCNEVIKPGCLEQKYAYDGRLSRYKIALCRGTITDESKNLAYISRNGLTYQLDFHDLPYKRSIYA